MEGYWEVVVGGIVIMVVTIAIVLALVLVLLAQLYCSPLLRRRQQPSSSLPVAKNDYASHSQGDSRRSLFQLLQEDSRTTNSSLASFYEQGVLCAAPPKSLFFTSFHCTNKDTTVNQHSQFPPFSPPKLVSINESGEVCGSNSTSAADNYIYICNPIYDTSTSIAGVEATPPFGTPDSSPSRLEEVGSTSSGEDEDGGAVVVCSCPADVIDGLGSHIMTPPLTPMKNLPAMAASVSLRQVRSLATTTTGSDSISSSHSTSASPCNSLSW